MIKALIKKQFMEIFRSYFVNRKTGKARSAAGVTGMFILFGGLMISLACAVFVFTIGMSLFFTGIGLDWLYFSIVGILSVALGTFGSVFNTFAALYRSKDNDLLLSMPIPPLAILLSRMSVVYGLSFLYSGIVWIPAIVAYSVTPAHAPLAVVFCVLLAFILPLFVTVLTCALGWVVALIAGKVKNKSLATVAFSLLFFFVYYFCCFRMGEFIGMLMENAQAVGEGMKLYGNIFYILGRAASADVVCMLLFCAVTFALFAGCLSVLSRTFTKIVTTPQKKAEKTRKALDFAAKNSGHALFVRELKRFTASPLYMLNCGLGIVIMPLLAVVLLIKRSALGGAIAEIEPFFADVKAVLPAMGALIVCAVIGLNFISTPSVSLEGKNLWILRSLPVSGREVVSAKLKLHFILNSVPAVLSSIVICIVFGADILTAVFALITVLAFIMLTGSLGLLIGIARPDFEWVSESQPIKQSINPLFSWLISIGIILLSVGIFILLYLVSSAQIALGCVSAICLGTSLAVGSAAVKRGGAMFDRL